MKKILVSLVCTFGFICGTANANADNDPVQSPPDSLSIAGTSLSIADTDGHPMVTSIGTIKNSSAVSYRSIVVEVRYFDAKGSLIDTITQPLYGAVAPASKEVAFRVRDDAARPKEAYATQTLRVISAVPKDVPRNTETQSNSSFFLNLLFSWGPMLLLIGVWLYCMRRMNRKDSPQVKAVALFEKQNTILENQNRLLERIALASEAGSIEK